MRGEFMGVWTATLTDIWDVLANQEIAPDDLFCELYREMSSAFKVRLKPEQLAGIIDDPIQSREAFQRVTADAFEGEKSLVIFLEGVNEVLDELVGDALANLYYNLLTTFIEKFSLRYDLRRPCTLCPTLEGMFASLVRDLEMATSRDAHLDSLMKDFDASIRDLRIDCSDRRIKTCIQKQINLLEAIGRSYPGVTRRTLGAICDQLGTWPHEKVKDAMKNLYTFTCDYPGIRHGGTRASSKRDIDMRDMVAMSILLLGFTPYLSDKLDADAVYRGT